MACSRAQGQALSRALRGRQIWPHTSWIVRHAARPERSCRTFATASSQYSLEQVIQRLQQNMRTGSELVSTQEMVVTGKGRHLGININWSIRWRGDGAFYEEISGRELCFKWGYDGGSVSSVWEMDSSGVARSLECDDHEALLICSWVRTGCWLQPHLIDRLELQLESPGGRSSSTGQQAAASQGSASSSQEGGPSSQVTASARAGAGAGASGSAAGQGSASQAQQRSEGQASTSGRPALPDLLGADDDKPLVVSMKLRGGKLVTRLRICPRKWAVQGLDQPLCGDTEVWEFGKWKLWQSDVMYPEALIHQAVAGGQHVYRTESCAVSQYSPLTSYQLPSTPLLPADTTYDSSKPTAVPVWRAGSGHLLVRPQINGKEGGFMVVDTGASGFVITPKAAVSLGLESFGELYAASISGKVPTHFVKAKTWALGPITISQPVMMTMSLDGLVRAAPPGADVIGIVGYDIFRRAVIELPQVSSSLNTLPAEQLPAFVAPSWAAPRAQSDEAGLDSPAASMSTVGSSGDGWSAAGQAVVGSGAREGGRTHSSAAASAASPSVSNGECSRDGSAAAGSSSSSVSPASSSSRNDSGRGSSPSSSGRGMQTGGNKFGMAASKSARQFTMHIHNPDSYTLEQSAGDFQWHTFRMIASLPHLEVRLGGSQGPGGGPLDVLLMLDSGACGADIMLHSRAMQELNLSKLGTPATSLCVRGVGGGSGDNSVRVETMDLPWVELAGVRFGKVRCMYAGVGGLDISIYSAGIVCGDLLGRLPCVIDYPRKRIALPRLGGSGAAASADSASSVDLGQLLVAGDMSEGSGSDGSSL